MKSIALRFAEKFAPQSGTIEAHREVIREKGFVWYGKLGGPIGENVAKEILAENNPRILLIHSGTAKRYWAYVSKISREQPSIEYIPTYYQNIADKFKCWFQIIDIVDASSNIMSKCVVESSGAILSNASKYSMSPYFKIDVDENVL